MDRNVLCLHLITDCSVALRKESVDRNVRNLKRRGFVTKVALRKESVDRNVLVPVIRAPDLCRSPQGERG